MALRSPGRLALAIFLIVSVTGATFSAQPAQPKHTLTFAELTVGGQITAMAHDAAGNAWFVGQTCSSALATTSDALQRTAPAGPCSGMFGRMTSDGRVTYLSYLGGTGYTYGTAIAVDASGSVYVGGYTYAPDFPTTAGAYDRTCGSDGTCQINKLVGGRPMTVAAADGFVAKLTPAADRLVYATYVGGADDDYIAGIAVDRSGRIHIAGSSISDDFPVTAGALQSAWMSGYDPDDNRLPDGTYARLSADGSSLEYGTYAGGWGSDFANAVAVNGAGDAFVTGTSTSPNLPVLNAVQPSSASAVYPWYSNPDAWIARFGAAGPVYSTYMGGSSADYGNAIVATDDALSAGGYTCSPDFPAGDGSTACRGYVTSADPSTGAVLSTTMLHSSGGFDSVTALAVDDQHQVYAAGGSRGSNPDAFLAIIDMRAAEGPLVTYSNYIGGPNSEGALAVTLDGAGGAYFGGAVTATSLPMGFPSSNAQPEPPPETSPNSGGHTQSFAAHVSQQSSTTASDVVLYARNASPMTGTWQVVADGTAAGGARVWNPDAGVGKLSTAAAAPASYFELTFDAPAGVLYHLWLRMKADNDSWQNDSVFVQFSDSVDAAANPVWRIGSTSATVVSLEDCSGCGEQGWGWNDNGYATAGTPVVFATSGTHTIRIQQREDGISIDQVVLSPSTYLNAAPGANKNDTTVLTSTAPNPDEVVIYAGDATAPAGTFQLVSDASAAGGTRLWNPDAGVGKLSTASATPANYVDVTFNARAGVPYHLWLRMKADNDSWQNDSVFVQFSDTVDGSGAAVWRLGSTSATIVSLEDCSGCGEQGWGWNDNGYNTAGTPVVFATTGPHTIRIQQREDGISIDQIVLSAVKYASAAPGAVRNDATIVAR